MRGHALPCPARFQSRRCLSFFVYLERRTCSVALPAARIGSRAFFYATTTRSRNGEIWHRGDAGSEDRQGARGCSILEIRKSALPLVEGEPATVSWFAIRVSSTTFGIFDVFHDEAGRNAHLAGAVAKALTAKAPELFSQPPKIQKVDVLASKLG